MLKNFSGFSLSRKSLAQAMIGLTLLLLAPVSHVFGQSLTDIKGQVAAASRPNPPWEGPRVGPVAARGKSIAVIVEDLRNGGILGVAQGVAEAARTLDWRVKVYDAGGTQEGRVKATASALNGRSDGVILIGSDAKNLHPLLLPFAKREIPIVGWHVGPKAGVMKNDPVAVNVSTDPLDVARITAMAAVAFSEGKAGVVIFTDSNFEIAMAKANAMADVIRACKECALLEVRDVAISESHEMMAGVTKDLLAKYGQRWTFALAINDIYFDYAVPELVKSGKTDRDMKMLSAGDGSSAAFMRIKTGSFQIGTVAEPLNLHGWQLADELNRLMSRQPANGHVVPVHLITSENVSHDGGPHFQFDPDNGYRDIYRQIWKK